VTEIHLVERQDPRARSDLGKRIGHRPVGELRVVLETGEVARLTWTMVGGQLLDIAELVAVASNLPVQGRERFAPGGILGDMGGD
jgi:ATP-dependent Lon protease